MVLCSEENQVPVNIYVLDAGWSGRMAIVSGNGVCLGDGKLDINVEEVGDHFARIDSLEETKPHDSGLNLFGYMGLYCPEAVPTILEARPLGAIPLHYFLKNLFLKKK